MELPKIGARKIEVEELGDLPDAIDGIIDLLNESITVLEEMKLEDDKDEKRREHLKNALESSIKTLDAQRNLLYKLERKHTKWKKR